MGTSGSHFAGNTVVDCKTLELGGTLNAPILFHIDSRCIAQYAGRTAAAIFTESGNAVATAEVSTEMFRQRNIFE